jgi:PAS domain S-box-containing protein
MATPEALWRSSFEQSATPLAAVDTRGTLAAWNNAFAKLFHSIASSPPESFSDSLFELIRQREGINFDYYAAQILLGGMGQADVETPVRTRDGQKRWQRISLSLLEPGNPAQKSANAGNNGERYILCSFEDVTDRTLRERSLREAKEEAEKATHTKSQFLANMSHEIRTPIQTILGVVELLGETRLDGEQSEYATQVRFSAEVLLGLINDILDFSKIEAGKLNLETTDYDILATAYQSADLLVMDAHRKGLEVVVDLGESIPAVVRGDPTRVRQIIVNLLKNAIKFTDEGGVSLVARLRRDGTHDRIRFEIRDSGVGIPDDMRDRLFTPFFQVDFAAARKTGGTGLGLAISRHLVEMMSGSIGVSVNSPRGSVFWFEIPLVVPEYTARATEFDIPSGGRRVLVVDDSSEARAFAVRVAARAGHQVVEAASGDEALVVLREAAGYANPFDICLIDQNMPRMDGWRLASEITQDAAINGLRLVLMVPEGSMGADAKMKLLRWFDDYLAKPLRPSFLIKTLAATDTVKDAPATGTKQRAGVEESDLRFDADVLIAEDHEVNRELFTVILDKLGCRVTPARDGQEAVEIAATGKPGGGPFDIILMDIFMPRMNGYEASRAIREAGYRGPLVAVTASALKGEREKCVEAGMNDILVKPFRKKDLAGVLSAWLPKTGSEGPENPAVRPQSQQLQSGDLPEEPLELLEALEVPKAAPLPDVEPHDILDLASVINTFLGQKSTVMSLLERFRDKARGQLVELESLLVASDYPRFREVAHSIKGAAWNLSARRLGDSARDAENAGRNGEAAAAQSSLAQLKTTFAEFDAIVTTILKTDPG